MIMLLTGCKTIRYFSMDVMEPAELYLPVNLDRILVAHNAFPDTSKAGGTPFVIYGQLLHDTIFRDSALARIATQTLSGMLSQIGRFEPILADSLGRGLPDKPENYTLEEVEKIKQWCRQNDADAFLILTSLNKKVTYDIYYGILGNTMGEFSTALSTRWLLIDPFKARLIDSKTFSDTMYLPVNNPYDRSDAANYNSSMDLLKETAEMSGLRYGSYISPHYAETERMVFKSGSRNLKKGYERAQQGDWKGAAAIWREALSKPDNKVRAQASFNLALASEMEGLLEPALDWAKKSYQYFPDNINKTYVEILEERIKNQKLIIKQMEGE